MFFIEAFDDADRYLLTVPCPFKLAAYDTLIEVINHSVARGIDILGRPDQLTNHDSLAAHYGRLLHAAQVWRESGCIASEDRADLNRLILILVLSAVEGDFRKMSRYHHVDIVLPPSIEQQPTVAWVMTTPTRRREVLAALDRKTRNTYLTQQLAMHVISNQEYLN